MNQPPVAALDVNMLQGVSQIGRWQACTLPLLIAFRTVNMFVWRLAGPLAALVVESTQGYWDIRPNSWPVENWLPQQRHWQSDVTGVWKESLHCCRERPISYHVREGVALAEICWTYHTMTRYDTDAYGSRCSLPLGSVCEVLSTQPIGSSVHRSHSFDHLIYTHVFFHPSMVSQCVTYVPQASRVKIVFLWKPSLSPLWTMQIRKYLLHEYPSILHLGW